jgi:hypothetical protein
MWRICFVRSVPIRGQIFKSAKPADPPVGAGQQIPVRHQSGARHRGEMTDAAAGVQGRAWERGCFIAPLPSAAPLSPPHPTYRPMPKDATISAGLEFVRETCCSNALQGKRRRQCPTAPQAQ